jgi:hypothetical protein
MEEGPDYNVTMQVGHTRGARVAHAECSERSGSRSRRDPTHPVVKKVSAAELENRPLVNSVGVTEARKCSEDCYPDRTAFNGPGQSRERV